MKWLAFILFPLVCLAQNAPLIPPQSQPVTNTLPWSIAGVPGGVPTYSGGVSVTSFGADPTGASDSATAINNAILAIGAGQKVTFPNGKYRINTPIVISGVPQCLLWGSSSTNVTIDSHVSSGLNSIYFHGVGVNTTNIISSGYQRGSTNLTLASTTGITTGCYAFLIESNNATLMPGGWDQEFNHRQMVRVLSVSGNNITIDVPIYISFSSASQPSIFSLNAPCTNSGIQGITLDCNNSTVGDGIWFYRSVGCWATDLVVTNVNTTSTGISVQESGQGQINLCVSGNNKTQASSSYGIQLVGANRWFVYDNIVFNTSSGVLAQNGSCANAIIANFDPGYWFTSVNDMAPGTSIHGDFAYMNDYEYNVMAQMGGGDSTHGSNATNTFLRNWIMCNNFRTNYPTDGRSGFIMAGTNYGNNFVGNVLALPPDGGSVPGGSHTDYDLAGDVGAASTYMYGNWSYFNGGYITGTNAPAVSGIPYSYAMNGYQTWMGKFGTAMIGSDVNTGNSITNGANTPAMARWLGVPYLPSTTNGSVTITGTIKIKGNAKLK